MPDDEDLPDDSGEDGVSDDSDETDPFDEGGGESTDVPVDEGDPIGPQNASTTALSEAFEDFDVSDLFSNQGSLGMDGWGAGMPDIDPYTGIAATDGPLGPYVGFDVNPYTIGAIDGANLNAYTGGQDVDPFTGTGADSTTAPAPPTPRPPLPIEPDKVHNLTPEELARLVELYAKYDAELATSKSNPPPPVPQPPPPGPSPETPTPSPHSPAPSNTTEPIPSKDRSVSGGPVSPLPHIGGPVSKPATRNSNSGFFNNPLWNALTNNTVSGATSLFENVNPITVNMPRFRDLAIRFGEMRGWDMALRAEDALSAPGSRLPGLFGSSSYIFRSRVPLGMSRASAVLAPLGVVSNYMSLRDAVKKSGDYAHSSPVERISDGTSSALGLFSSLVGTTALAGAGLSAAGATTAGGAITGAAAALSPAAAVAGAAAGGYALGKLGDQAVGGLMNITGASDAIDKARGISRADGQNGDYSITGLGALGATALDQLFTRTMRNFGAYDTSKPAYTQTIGWWLADHL